MDIDDFDFENFGDNHNRKKKKAQGGRKGKRVERELCKILTERFKKEFSRSVGSGNRWSQIANMPKHARETFSGDVCTPENFLWVIESKGGYEDKIDLNGLFDGIGQLDAFIKQVSKDAEFTKKKPLLVWKRSRKPWLACAKTEDLCNVDRFEYRIIYGKWSVVSLSNLLEYPDEFFFGDEKC